jgi:ferredoxin-NADP reductase
MIRALVHHEPSSTIKLLYASRAADNIIFKHDIDALVAQYPQLSVQHFISGQNRITQSDLVATQDSHYYICGPDSLKTAVL